MNQKLFLYHLVISTLLLITLDNIWFRIMDYSQVVTKQPVNIPSAIFTWVLIATAIATHLQTSTSAQQAVSYGLATGFIIYGVYNGTNYAILQDWPVKVAVADTIWGSVVCGVVSGIVYSATMN